MPERTLVKHCIPSNAKKAIQLRIAIKILNKTHEMKVIENVPVGLISPDSNCSTSRKPYPHMK